MMTFPQAFSVTCGLCVLDVNFRKYSNLQDTRTFEFTYSLWVNLECLQCVHPFVSMLLHRLTPLCCFMCSAAVHLEHKRAISKVALFILSLDWSGNWQSITQRFLLGTAMAVRPWFPLSALFEFTFATIFERRLQILWFSFFFIGL